MTGSSAEEVLYTIKAFENKVININLPNNQRIKEVGKPSYSAIFLWNDEAGKTPFRLSNLGEDAISNHV